MINDDTANAQGRNYSRRRFVKSLLAATIVSLPAGGLLLNACGDAATPTTGAITTTAAVGTTGTTTTVAASTTASAATASAGTTTAAVTSATSSSSSILKSPGPNVPDAFLAEPQPLFQAVKSVPGRNDKVRVLNATTLPPVPSKDQNRYWQEAEKRLGVTWDVNLVPSASYPEKFSLMIAGGDIPELVYLQPSANPEQLKVIQQGAFLDLTPYVTGDALKDYPNLAAYSPQTWSNSRIGGKLYGVPRPRFLTGNILLYRRDWATQVSNPDPKNADELYKLFEDFTKKDPDGDGQANTWGFGYVGSGGGLAQFDFFFNVFRVPNQWKKNSDGSLTYFVETQEFKDAISFLRRLNDNGLIYPDSPSLTSTQATDAFVGGKFGSFQNTVTGIPTATGRRAAAQKINPKADVVALVPPGFDGGKAYHFQGAGFLGMAGIPAKLGQDKERVMELLRILDYLSTPFGSEEYHFKRYGLDGVHNERKSDGSIALTDLGNKEIGNIMDIANGPLPIYYPGYPDQPALVQDTIRRHVEISIPDPSIGAVSATWTNKSKELTDFITDRTLRVITGREQVSALDDMVKEWRNRGGADVAKEFAASLKSA